VANPSSDATRYVPANTDKEQRRCRRSARGSLSQALRYEEAASVLRITLLSQKGLGLTIKLEGVLLGPWVGSFRDACAARGCRTLPLRLDLAAVTYVDAAGVQLLRDLMTEGAEIAAYSSFVRELLHPDS